MIKNIDKLIMLMDEIAIAKNKLQPHDTGHIHTSINYLESRVEEIRNELDAFDDHSIRLNRKIWDVARKDGTINNV